MVTVSIVTYHTSTDELDHCMASLSSPVVDHVYIIDNGEEHRIAEWASKYNNTIYLSAPNPGYGAAHNIALRQALKDGARYHLVLNSDVRFDPSVLDALVTYMEAHSNVGQIQPKVIYPDGTLQHTCRMLPTPLDVFGRRFLPQCMMRKRNSRYTLCHLDSEKTHNIPYHQGSFMFLRMKAIEQEGMFDERFFMYPEDIDLTRRIHRNWQTLYYPAVSIIHDHRAASYHSLRMTWIHANNMVKYFNKWGWWFDSERRRFNTPLRHDAKNACRR